MPLATSQFFVIFSIKVSFHKTHNISMPVKAITLKTQIHFANHNLFLQDQEFVIRKMSMT